MSSRAPDWRLLGRHLFEPALNLEQLSSMLEQQAPDLAADENLLVEVLRQATGYGHLTESRDDTATYRDPAEFRRRSSQWSLTDQGQALIAALDAAADQMARVASELLQDPWGPNEPVWWRPGWMRLIGFEERLRRPDTSGRP